MAEISFWSGSVRDRATFGRSGLIRYTFFGVKLLKCHQGFFPLAAGVYRSKDVLLMLS